MEIAKRHGKIFAALFAGLFVLTCLDVLYMRTMGGYPLLTGIPTPGGAPLFIHVINMGLKGAYAALAYGLVMRGLFGRVSWGRVAVLWAVGLTIVAVLGGMAMAGALSVELMGWIGLALYFAIGHLFVGAWVSQ